MQQCAVEGPWGSIGRALSNPGLVHRRTQGGSAGDSCDYGDAELWLGGRAERLMFLFTLSAQSAPAELKASRNHPSAGGYCVQAFAFPLAHLRHYDGAAEGLGGGYVPYVREGRVLICRQ